MTATVTAADLAAAEVELTSDEQDLVRVLVAAAAAHQTTVRICGGWVRDKALGRVTKDVDIALDNCSGATFAERVVEALAKGLQGGDGRGAALAASSTVGLIAANPEQSKHLETATMRLCGVEVDFVNLRSESYADAGDSRIPTMAFGTPQEDAARRDFTLNALFFNVHTQRIEDLTGRGWEDLRAGLLRTPLEPRVTLLDDPLRALRGVRFASRYGFALDPGFAEACLLPEVRAALLTKVSRERVGKEVWGALGTSPAGAARAVDELRRLQLASATFRGVGAAELAGAARGPDGSAVALDAVYATDADDTGGPWLLAARCCAALAAGEAQTAAEPLPTRNATLAALACALLPLTDPGCEALDRRRRPTPLPQVVCKEGLKLPGRTATDARRVLDAAPRLAKLAARLAAGETSADLRRDAGLVLFEVQELWRCALRVARARAVAFEATNFGDAAAVAPADAAVASAERDFGALEAALAGPTLDLDRIWATLQPHYDGNALAEALDVPKGPLIGGLLAEQRQWQLAQPAGDKDACLAYLQSRVDDLRQTHGQGRRGGKSKKARR